MITEMPERYAVASSNISSVGYDPDTQTLEIEFLSGSIYQYYGVPNHMYEELMRQSSKGKFVNTYIRNQYPFSRIG
jgi:hypothetical protein